MRQLLQDVSSGDDHRRGGPRPGAGARRAARGHPRLADQRRHRASGDGDGQQVAGRQGARAARPRAQGRSSPPARRGLRSTFDKVRGRLARAQRARLLRARHRARGARRLAGRAGRARRLRRRGHAPATPRSSRCRARSCARVPEGVAAEDAAYAHGGRDRAARRAPDRAAASATWPRSSASASSASSRSSCSRAAGCVALGRRPRRGARRSSRASAGFWRDHGRRRAGGRGRAAHGGPRRRRRAGRPPRPQLARRWPTAIEVGARACDGLRRRRRPDRVPAHAAVRQGAAPRRLALLRARAATTRCYEELGHRLPGRLRALDRGAQPRGGRCG